MLTEKELGERLKNIREVRRVSQFRLGEMVECGQGHIGKLEKGEHYPKLPTLYKISEALNISLKGWDAVAGGSRRKHPQMENTAGAWREETGRKVRRIAQQHPKP